MSIYSAKHVLESAVSPENVIQTPDDTGVDLDAIEKAIVGDDGIEAHRDEVEAAEEGLIGDPVAEAYEIMFESEYNYNQLMHMIGIHELCAASSGRELVLEAVDIKGFFARVKEILANMFAAITKAFRKVAQTIGASVSNDKKLVTKYRAAIEAGADTDWEAKGYVFKDKIAFESKIFNGEDWTADAQLHLNQVKDGKTPELIARAELTKEIIKKIADVDANSVAEMNEVLYKSLRGNVSEPITLTKSNMPASKIIAILEGDKEIKEIKDGFNQIKKSYDVALKTIAKLESEITGKEYGDVSKAFAVCEYYTTALKTEKTVQNGAYTTLLKAAKDKRAQARRLALMLVKQSPLPEKEKKVKVNNESGSLFGGLTLI